ncbi:MAG: hypothetical protein M1514_03115 [Patescibacteria group bacterium]|nr:hypothetical protein [Patescibacteria group bacterium]
MAKTKSWVEKREKLLRKFMVQRIHAEKEKHLFDMLDYSKVTDPEFIAQSTEGYPEYKGDTARTEVRYYEEDED